MKSQIKQKIEKCFKELLRVLSKELKKYISTVETGQNHLTMLIAHTAHYRHAKCSDIENTEIFQKNPDIKLKLLHNISLEIDEEENMISAVLDQLQKVYWTIENQCDKILNLCQINLYINLSIEDVTYGTESSYCIAKEVEAVEEFKRLFSTIHLARKYTLNYHRSGGNLEK
ncbi:hypothetical protein X975_05255, partial [Stegodyphus mimosarum]